MSRVSPIFLGVVSSDYGKPRNVVTLKFHPRSSSDEAYLIEPGHRFSTNKNTSAFFQGTYEQKHVDFFWNQTQQKETER